jgi:DNA-binding MarR family transcriptional regulator
LDLVCVCAATRQAARVLTSVYDQELRPAGLQATQFALLATLEGHPLASQDQLSAWLATEQSTLSRNLQGLARKGWVARRSDPDGRAARYEATPRGRAVLARARPGWKRAQARVKRTLGEDWDRLAALLKKLTRL